MFEYVYNKEKIKNFISCSMNVGIDLKADVCLYRRSEILFLCPAAFFGHNCTLSINFPCFALSRYAEVTGMWLHYLFQGILETEKNYIIAERGPRRFINKHI